MVDRERTMRKSVLAVASAALLALGLGAPPARADIYTWIDASGVTNVSNLPPPDGAKVTKVQRALPPEILAREDAARDAARQAEAQALAARVRQLEDEARAAPPPDYRPVIPPPPVIQYIVQAPPPPMQQTVEITQPAYSPYGYGGYGYGCDPSWFGCWWPGFYPAGVFVVSTPGKGRNDRPVHHGNNMITPPLPPPFGPPLVPTFKPSPPQKFAVQPSVGSPMRLTRG
jgi:hypothetical protein